MNSGAETLLKRFSSSSNHYKEHVMNQGTSQWEPKHVVWYFAQVPGTNKQSSLQSASPEHTCPNSTDHAMARL